MFQKQTKHYSLALLTEEQSQEMRCNNVLMQTHGELGFCLLGQLQFSHGKQ